MSNNHDSAQPEPRQQRLELSWENETAAANPQNAAAAAEHVIPPEDTVLQKELLIKEPVAMDQSDLYFPTDDLDADLPKTDDLDAVAAEPKKLLLKKPASEVQASPETGEPARPRPVQLAIIQAVDDSTDEDEVPEKRVIRAFDSQTIKMEARQHSGQTVSLEPDSVEPPSDGLGAMLRNARQTRGLELSTVAEDTRINSDYITALEAEDFDKLPLAAIYIKSYLKTLGQRYGLEPETLINMYGERQAQGRAGGKGSESAQNAEKSSNQNSVKSKNSGRDGETLRFKRFAWAIAAMFVLVFCIIGAAIVKDRVFSPGLISRDDLTTLTAQDLQRYTLPETLPFSELEMPNRLESAAQSGAAAGTR